ncbi:hypothetical protein [Faecalibacter macacae]|uniref:Uncharacterized protein n=1 Tax=Faecalibacter macacae TaxID=1859289 RepID=A0A3L9M7Q5_9FLAO|nr:hypothetical protein [Faecalibacter macacae]RLZ08563.1 hypothetical protein EAH69_09620 [Faecalibacter macacae]
MDKSIKKRLSYNTEVVKALSEEFGVSTTFVRQAIRKDKHSLTAQTIEKKYKELAGASLRAIKDFKKNPII